MQIKINRNNCTANCEFTFYKNKYYSVYNTADIVSPKSSMLDNNNVYD